MVAPTVPPIIAPKSLSEFLPDVFEGDASVDVDVDVDVGKVDVGKVSGVDSFACGDEDLSVCR